MNILLPYKHGEACLQLLLKSKQPVTLNDMMHHLHLSRRSVLYLLKKLTHSLEAQKLPPIENIPRIGYVLPEKSKQQLLSDKAETPSADVLLHPEQLSFMLKNLTSSERHILIDFILITQPPVSIRLFLNVFHASRNTILRELREMANFNQDTGLIIQVTKKGRRINSPELTQRYWVLENFSAILQIINKHYPLPTDQQISQALHAYEETAGSLLTDDSRHIMKYFLSWYCHRLQQGYLLPDNYLASEAPASIPEPVRQWAKSFLAAQQCQSEQEILYLSNIMQFHSLSAVKHTDALYQKLYASSQELVKSFSSISGLTIEIDEHLLLDSLTVHLISAYHRLKNNVRYHNPLLAKIKSEHSNLFYITKTAVHVLEKDLQLHFSDDETALLATYFGSAIIRNKITAPQRRILVVCSSGIGTSQFLLLQLRQRYPQLQFTGPLNVENCCRMNMQDVGLIITTTPLPLTAKDTPPILYVSPLPTRYEWQKLKEQLIMLNFEHDEKSHHNIQSLIDVISEYAKIEDYPGLARGLQKFFAQQDATPVTMHSHTVEPDSILKYVEYIDLPIKNWQEAIFCSFYRLLRGKFVEQRYINKIVDLLDERGDYMVLGKEILLAHAKPEDGVHECSASLTLFHHPFLTSRNRTVRCIISLAPIDASSHLSFLALLLQKLNTPNWCEELYSITSQKELENFIWQTFQ